MNKSYYLLDCCMQALKDGNAEHQVAGYEECTNFNKMKPKCLEKNQEKEIKNTKSEL